MAEGVSLSVRVWDGAEPGFLLVHGLASNARMWDGVASELAAAGHGVAALDLRGHGRSDKPDEGYDFATMASDVVAVAVALGWPQPVMAGQSWGGNLVVEVAFRHPAAVRGVAGVDGGEIELWRRFPDWEECARTLAPPSFEGRTIEWLEARIRGRCTGWPESGVQGLLANFEARADGTVAPWLTRDRHMKILRALWEHRPSEQLRSIDVPVLMIPASTVPGGDHDLHAQHPTVVAGLLLERFA